MRGPATFRAIREPRSKDQGFALSIQVRRGDHWQSGLAGLDESDVDAQFARLRRQGCVLESTADYTVKEATS